MTTTPLEEEEEGSAVLDALACALALLGALSLALTARALAARWRPDELARAARTPAIASATFPMCIAAIAALRFRAPEGPGCRFVAALGGDAAAALVVQRGLHAAMEAFALALAAAAVAVVLGAVVVLAACAWRRWNEWRQASWRHSTTTDVHHPHHSAPTGGAVALRYSRVESRGD